MAKPTESLTFKKHFNNVMDYCEKDETNPDIPLYICGLSKRLYKRHGKSL